jgi:hypothetical protein
VKATGKGQSFLSRYLLESPQRRLLRLRRCDMVNNGTCAVNSLNSYNGLFIFVTAPHQTCCQCEQKLKPRYGGICIWFRIYPCPLLLAVCASCLGAGLRAISSGGREVRVISPRDMESIFDEDRILAFAQVRRWGDIVCLEPFPNPGEPTRA